MKKIMSSMVIIVTTIALVTIMAINYDIDSEGGNPAPQSVKINENRQKADKIEKQRNKKDIVKNDNSNNKNNAPIQKDESQNKENQEEKKPDQDNIDDKTQVQNKESSDDEKEDTTVFKVDKNTIASKISLIDKAKLLYYSKKLSAVDEGRIQKLLKSGDEYNASVNIFKILKERLSKDEYGKIKEILSPYIYISKIEKSIN